MRESVVPIFPLPRYVLFPGGASPLRVFEPRYRRMVEDLLDGPGRLVMASIDPAHVDEAAGNPPLLPIGSLAEIARHRKLPNGEFLLWVVGIARVRLDEVDSDAPYRRTRVRVVEDPSDEGPQAFGLRTQLRAAIAERSTEALDLDESAPLGLLADILAQCLVLDAERQRALFYELDPRIRADLALAEHRTAKEPPAR